MNFLCKLDTSINCDLNGKNCAQPNGLICFSQTVSQSVECMDFITLEWSQIKSSIASRCNENKNNLLCVNEWEARRLEISMNCCWSVNQFMFDKIMQQSAFYQAWLISVEILYFPFSGLMLGLVARETKENPCMSPMHNIVTLLALERTNLESSSDCSSIYCSSMSNITISGNVAHMH